ncbi:DNA-binding MarR family transcriptional regulator [Arthrobacter sp. UYP6]|uniref:MarR family winged helix-turn-helix transcriptional regulator n=1 Tax=Arthrobacter sp. UYP6 TaxID=1756378 RepID=UPI00339A16B2
MEEPNCHVPGLNAEESQAWRGLIRTMQLLPPVLDAQLQRDDGLTHFEFMVLIMLELEPGTTMRMTVLATRTNATLPRLSNVCARMEDRGLIIRSVCPNDRRATNVALTGAGEAVLSSAKGRHIELVRKVVIDALTPQQITALAEISDSIDAALDRHAANGPMVGTAGKK